MDIRNIQTFIRVSELGSFTKAANELGYVQPAITMQIKQLEKELGFPLFDRVGKKVSLTAPGCEFLEYAYEITKTMQKATNLGKNIADMRGKLRVGILESLLFGNMLKLLPEFKKEYKNLDLHLKMGRASELVQQLKQNQLDMIYVSSGLNTDPDLRCYYKRCEHLIFVCKKDHPMARRKKVTLRELFDEDFIVAEHSGICYGRLMELANRHNAELSTSIEVDSTVAIAALLQKSTALAFLPEYSVQKQLEEGSLARVDVDIEPQTYYSQILCHKRCWVSPFMEKMIEKIRSEYPEEE